MLYFLKIILKFLLQIPSIHIYQYTTQVLGVILALLDDSDESVQLTAVSCLLMVSHLWFPQLISCLYMYAWLCRFTSLCSFNLFIVPKFGFMYLTWILFTLCIVTKLDPKVISQWCCGANSAESFCAPP